MRRTRLRRWLCRGRERAVWLEVVEHRGLFVQRVAPCWHYLDQTAAPIWYFSGGPVEAGHLLRQMGESLDWSDCRRARQHYESVLRQIPLEREWGTVAVEAQARGWFWHKPRPPPQRPPDAKAIRASSSSTRARSKG